MIFLNLLYKIDYQPIPVLGLLVGVGVGESLPLGTASALAEAKQRAYAGVLLADTKPFYGHGSTNTTMKMCGLPSRSFLIGKTLRYYWN
jgi:hypothetical protein